MPHSQAPTSQARIVTCPSCGGDSVYSPANVYRPFCCERCKQMDLGAWASESFRMPTEVPPDDAPHGDPRQQH
ncbi:DNA gyrase inhibitor YacG [Acidovorax sp. D2M1]|uniref:DNA gyrase inhibitor YacG n=1 Tax=Acidovorax benzenivorans TaxID=2987520 RepID=A0ABT5S0M7_9BURK|nr:DNA gyrase inhibitor YacG [Acidovorax benzenivorans]MDD2179495.1 DNA gyrase inhibitor YacG [Acidovorax benzenivorans]